jgi:hypothetical protein
MSGECYVDRGKCSGAPPCDQVDDRVPRPIANDEILQNFDHRADVIRASRPIE